MKAGEEILVSNGADRNYYCRIEEISDEAVKAAIYNVDDEGSELDTEFYLFQCLPKSDKMEFIIQKAVELGVKEIIPVKSKRAVVKLDEKKADAKVKRWNLISESAAKQSKRIIIPKVSEPMTFDEAVKYSKNLDMSLIPYENYRDMSQTRIAVDKIESGMKVGIFIGPEGGFDESEVDLAVSAGIERISLGRRILRTETAGMAVLSVLMFKMER
jgi:16S rRNA (uracil1498-N3)-methyltransferase